MNLRSVDLNLLVILEALLEEAHVTRAANRLALSQSATSNALDRCRQLFDDPLLTRIKGRMTLTARAERLRGPVSKLLAEVRTVVAHESDSGPPSGTVRIGMADVLVSSFGGHLYRRLSEIAPRVRTSYFPWTGSADLLRMIEQGDLDLSVSIFPSHFPKVRAVELAYSHYRIALRTQHPALSDFNLDTWLRYEHVVVSSRGSERGALDDALHALGRTRCVALVVPSFLNAVQVLRDTDLIGLIPDIAIQRSSSEGIITLAPPIPVGGFPLYLC
jgi:DNA-binding transcriptional LysR family regulator